MDKGGNGLIVPDDESCADIMNGSSLSGTEREVSRRKARGRVILARPD